MDGADSSPAVSDNSPEDGGLSALTGEVNKWKSLSRTNEKRWHAASAELDILRTEHATMAEEAAEQIRADTRKAVLVELGPQLVMAEMTAQAARAEIEITDKDLKFMPLGQFLGEDGTVDRDLIGEYIRSRPDAKPPYAQNLGLGRQGGPIRGFSVRSLDARYR
ncbi:hypothetical protein ACFC1T_04385 [Kitasatospora sp. NPDC056076]|uniref:hypothetical protein n=1 Tax=Kitasatospora sp. NPDC056076 TaxID=3345703 RepID=UPI0035D58DCE